MAADTAVLVAVPYPEWRQFIRPVRTGVLLAAYACPACSVFKDVLMRMRGDAFGDWDLGYALFPPSKARALLFSGPIRKFPAFVARGSAGDVRVVNGAGDSVRSLEATLRSIGAGDYPGDEPACRDDIGTGA